MRCSCFLRNVSCVQFYGSTPYFRRFGEAFKGHKVPFGAEIGFMKFDSSVRAIRDHPLYHKVHKGLFIGYDLRPGGQWSGDYYVVAAEMLANADSVHHVKAIRVKNLIVPEYFVFPCATGSLKQPEDIRKDHVSLDDGKSDCASPDALLDFPQVYSDDELDNQ